MTVVTLPYDFVGGTRAIANQVDANFNALANALNTGIRTTATGAVTFYVSPTGVDTPGNGLSPSTPVRTITYILNLIYSSYDLVGNPITIQLADGIYNETVVVRGKPVGAHLVAQLTITGNAISPANVSVTGDPAFSFGNHASCALQNMQVNSLNSSSVVSQNGANVALYNVIFGAAPNGAHVLSRFDGLVTLPNNYAIAGGGQYHLETIHGEIVVTQVSGVSAIPPPVSGIPTVAIIGTPAFSVAFLSATECGTIRWFPAITGTATGPMYSVSLNGTINTRGLGNVPGNAAGSTATGGQFA